jgi:hypothetical protein
MTEKTQWRRLDRVRRHTLPKPEPDMTGWSEMDVFMWHLDRHGLEELLRQAYAEEPSLDKSQ